MSQSQFTASLNSESDYMKLRTKLFKSVFAISSRCLRALIARWAFRGKRQSHLVKASISEIVIGTKAIAHLLVNAIWFWRFHFVIRSWQAFHFMTAGPRAGNCGIFQTENSDSAFVWIVTTTKLCWLDYRSVVCPFISACPFSSVHARNCIPIGFYVLLLNHRYEPWGWTRHEAREKKSECTLLVPSGMVYVNSAVSNRSCEMQWKKCQ